MKKQLVRLLLSIILPLSIAGCKSSMSPTPQITTNSANIPQVNMIENYQSSFVQRMQTRETDRQQAIANIQSGAKIDRAITRIAPEAQIPKSAKIYQAARAHRHVN